MRPEIFAMLVPGDSLRATLLVRRASGEFSFARIDARLAAASRVAAGWVRNHAEVVHDDSSEIAA
jgi:hypothetical protein